MASSSFYVLAQDDAHSDVGEFDFPSSVSLGYVLEHIKRCKDKRLSINGTDGVHFVVRFHETGHFNDEDSVQGRGDDKDEEYIYSADFDIKDYLTDYDAKQHHHQETIDKETFIIRTLDKSSSRIKLLLLPTTTIADVKAELADLTSIPEGNFHLLDFGNKKILQDDVSIADCDGQCYIALLLKGGGKTLKSNESTITKKAGIMAQQKLDLQNLFGATPATDVLALVKNESDKIAGLNRDINTGGIKLALKKMLSSVSDPDLETLTELSASRPDDRLHELSEKFLFYYVPKLIKVEKDVQLAKDTATTVVRMVLAECLMKDGGQISWKEMDKIVQMEQEVREHLKSKASEGGDASMG
eukprot:s2465_g1.t1